MVCDGWCNMWAAPIKGKSYQLHCLVGGELGSCGSEAAGLQSAFSPHPDPVTLPTHPSTPTHPPYAIIFPSRAFLLIANSTAAHPTEPSIYTGWFFRPNFSAQKKNVVQPTRIFCTLKISSNIISDWLLIVFHFGTENWEKQLKKTPCMCVLHFKVRHWFV